MNILLVGAQMVNNLALTFSQNNIGCASTPNTTIRFTLYATTICKIVMSRHIWRHFNLYFFCVLAFPRINQAIEKRGNHEKFTRIISLGLDLQDAMNSYFHYVKTTIKKYILILRVLSGTLVGNYKVTLFYHRVMVAQELRVGRFAYLIIRVRKS